MCDLRYLLESNSRVSCICMDSFGILWEILFNVLYLHLIKCCSFGSNHVWNGSVLSLNFSVILREFLIKSSLCAMTRKDALIAFPFVSFVEYLPSISTVFSFIADLITFLVHYVLTVEFMYLYAFILLRINSWLLIWAPLIRLLLNLQWNAFLL